VTCRSLPYLVRCCLRHVSQAHQGIGEERRALRVVGGVHYPRQRGSHASSVFHCVTGRVSLCGYSEYAACCWSSGLPLCRVPMSNSLKLLQTKSIRAHCAGKHDQKAKSADAPTRDVAHAQTPWSTVTQFLKIKFDTVQLCKMRVTEAHAHCAVLGELMGIQN